MAGLRHSLGGIFEVLSIWMPRLKLGITENHIRIVAALVCDDLGRVLLVRKRGTRALIRPGGKLVASESYLVALQRELNKELKCSMEPASAVFLGTFIAPAANETGYLVEAVVYSVSLIGRAQCAAEIERSSGSAPSHRTRWNSRL